MTDGNDAADAEDAPARTACAGESPAPSDILMYAFGGWGRLCERPQYTRVLRGLRPKSPCFNEDMDKAKKKANE